MKSKPVWWRGARGEWYVVVQTGLFAVVLFGPRTIAGLPWPIASAMVSMSVGGVLVGLGLGVSIVAAPQLGINLTPLPHPRDNSCLVVGGLYRLVRHPIYFGIILMAVGWALFVQGWLTLAYAVVLVLFFDIKSRREEVWLMQHFSEYAEYRRHAKKLIPFIY